jgi:hypothetical protein
MSGYGYEAGSESISQRHGSADPDPQQNVMDPQPWWQQLSKYGTIRYVSECGSGSSSQFVRNEIIKYHREKSKFFVTFSKEIAAFSAVQNCFKKIQNQRN